MINAFLHFKSNIQYCELSFALNGQTKAFVRTLPIDAASPLLPKFDSIFLEFCDKLDDEAINTLEFLCSRLYDAMIPIKREREYKKAVKSLIERS